MKQVRGFRLSDQTWGMFCRARDAKRRRRQPSSAEDVLFEALAGLRSRMYEPEGEPDDWAIKQIFGTEQPNPRQALYDDNGKFLGLDGMGARCD